MAFGGCLGKTRNFPPGCFLKWFPRHVALLEFCSDALKTSFVTKYTNWGGGNFKSFGSGEGHT